MPTVTMILSNCIDPDGLQSSAEKDLWNRLPEAVDYWTRIIPEERKRKERDERKRMLEEAGYIFPPNKTPIKPPLPFPFPPNRPTPDGEKCEK